MRPPNRGNEPVKPQNCYIVFPAKQFFHDMGQRVVELSLANHPELLMGEAAQKRYKI